MIPSDLKHFTPAEFKAPPAAVDSRLCRALDALREAVAAPITINNTFALAGHGAHSRHRLSPCDAADIVIRHVAPAVALRAILTSPFGGVGWYRRACHGGQSVVIAQIFGRELDGCNGLGC